MNTDDTLITQLTDIEDNVSGLTTIQMTDEEWEKMAFEKPYYSDDENIQKKFEFAVKHTGTGRVLSALCKELDVLELKLFIEEYFENNELWTDYYKD